MRHRLAFERLRIRGTQQSQKAETNRQEAYSIKSIRDIRRERAGNRGRGRKSFASNIQPDGERIGGKGEARANGGAKNACIEEDNYKKSSVATSDKLERSRGARSERRSTSL